MAILQSLEQSWPTMHQAFANFMIATEMNRLSAVLTDVFRLHDPSHVDRLQLVVGNKHTATTVASEWTPPRRQLAARPM